MLQRATERLSACALLAAALGVSAAHAFDPGDVERLRDGDLKVVTKRAPTADELRDLRFAFTVCKHVRSNAIVFAKDGATVGVGAGQMSRLDAVRIAVEKAAEASCAAGAPGPRKVSGGSGGCR